MHFVCGMEVNINWLLVEMFEPTVSVVIGMLELTVDPLLCHEAQRMSHQTVHVPTSGDRPSAVSNPRRANLIHSKCR